MSWLPHSPTTSEQDATENFEAIARRLMVGKGSPEGCIAAPVATLYLREDGSTGTTLYVKESAASPTDPKGWVAK